MKRIDFRITVELTGTIDHDGSLDYTALRREIEEGTYAQVHVPLVDSVTVMSEEVTSVELSTVGDTFFDEHLDILGA